MDNTENTLAFELEARYMRCNALLNSTEHVCSEDKEAIMWIFEEEFGKLGEAIAAAIEIVRSK